MDRSVLQALLERYHLESYAWALNCCLRNSIDAEGVMQTVYLKILQRKARFDGKASFKTWLFSVIRKTAADERRRKVLHRLKLIKYEESFISVQKESPDEAVYRSEIQMMFRQALVTLPKRQREVLQLVFYHDLSLAEAAKVMRVSVGSARTHYDRGKKQLRQWMEGAKVLDESGLGRKENKGSVQ